MVKQEIDVINIFPVHPLRHRTLQQQKKDEGVEKRQKGEMIRKRIREGRERLR